MVHPAVAARALGEHEHARRAPRWSGLGRRRREHLVGDRGVRLSGRAAAPRHPRDGTAGTSRTLGPRPRSSPANGPSADASIPVALRTRPPPTAGPAPPGCPAPLGRLRSVTALRTVGADRSLLALGLPGRRAPPRRRTLLTDRTLDPLNTLLTLRTGDALDPLRALRAGDQGACLGDLTARVRSPRRSCRPPSFPRSRRSGSR